MSDNAEENYLDDSLKRITRGAGIIFFGTLIGMTIGYLSRLIIARGLGPAFYGLISLAFAGLSVAATLGAFGLPGGGFPFDFRLIDLEHVFRGVSDRLLRTDDRFDINEECQPTLIRSLSSRGA